MGQHKTCDENEYQNEEYFNTVLCNWQFIRSKLDQVLSQHLANISGEYTVYCKDIHVVVWGGNSTLRG